MYKFYLKLSITKQKKSSSIYKSKTTSVNFCIKKIIITIKRDFTKDYKKKYSTY